MRSLLEGILIRFTSVSHGAIYLRDFFEFFQIKPSIVQSDKPIPFPNPILQGFTFENVGFKYSNADHWANRHLNFTLHPGQKIALVGENGSGKTTLVKLLTRLYDPTEGRILLDGIDLREYNLSQLRIQIGIIFQDFIKYQMSVAQNIAVGNINENNNRDLIIASAQQSLAHPTIENLPNKYDQSLGRRFNEGIELSGGEWQKIALTRSYMKDAQLLILDEHNRQRGLQKVTRALAKGKLTKQHINNRGYNKYLKLDGEITITINYDKYNDDAKWDGLKGYITNTILKQEEVIENYKHLWQIEKAFRISKTDLRIRPIYHRLQRRICSHICIAFASYKIYKELERQLKLKQSDLSAEKAISILRTIFGINLILSASKKKNCLLIVKHQEQIQLLKLFEIEF